jgi:hypothetical protein
VFCPVYKMAHAEQHMEEVEEILARKLAEKHPIRAVLYRIRVRIIRWRSRWRKGGNGVHRMRFKD